MVDAGPTLDGIALEVCNREPYLEALWHAIDQGYPEMKPIVNEIERLLGRTPQKLLRDGPPDVSFSLIDREWFDSEDNEFDELVRYLNSHGLLDGFKSVCILGAGTCRLGDHLASLDHVESVTCADLSWLVLYFGRALIENRTDLLPEVSRRDRVVYRVDHVSRKLLATSQPARFKAPLATNRFKIGYEVKDAFRLSQPAPSDMICLPYLLDHFEGPRVVSLLIRVCQQMRIGQELLLLVSCVPRRVGTKGRDPAAIAAVLASCGMSMEYVDLADLPYTFSYYNFAHYRAIWTTLVIRAKCTAEPDLDSIAIVDKSKPAESSKGEAQLGTAGCRTRDGFVMSRISADSALILAACETGRTCGEIFSEVQARMAPARFLDILGELTAGDLADLEFR